MPGLSRRRFLAIAGAAAFLRAPASMSAGAQVVPVDGIPIRVVRAGRGRPVCLIHGASGNLNDMTFRLAPALQDR